MMHGSTNIMGRKCSNAGCMCCITTLTTQPYLYSDTTHPCKFSTNNVICILTDIVNLLFKTYYFLTFVHWLGCLCKISFCRNDTSL